VSYADLVILHRQDKYLDIPLVLKAFGQTTTVGSVEEAFRKFIEVEVLDVRPFRTRLTSSEGEPVRLRKVQEEVRRSQGMALY
jgi:hypothetical protein